MALRATGQSSSSDRKKLLQKMLNEIPGLLEEAVDACTAPRHQREARDEYGKMLRRKWFGRKRGRIRHTFKDILRHIEARDVFVDTDGQHHEGAHAYTPDDQKLKIYLCPLFYRDSVDGQLATIVHELTHLVRKTIDFEEESPSLEDVLRFETIQDKINITPENIKEQKKAFFIKFANDERSATSAYNFEYFILDLISEVRGTGVIDEALKPVR